MGETKPLVIPLEDKIKLFADILTVKTKDPFVTSHGEEKDRHIIRVILRYKGFEGMGSASPYYRSDYDPHRHANRYEPLCVIESYIREAKEVLGNIRRKIRNPFSNSSFHEELKKITTQFSPSGKAAIDIAFYDLISNILDRKLIDLLKENYPDLRFTNLKSPRTTYTFGIEEPERLKDMVIKALDAGYRVFKLKIGATAEQIRTNGSDQQRLEAVKNAIQNSRVTDAQIKIVDANCGYSPNDNLQELGEMLRNYGVEFLEQPFDPSCYGDNREMIDAKALFNKYDLQLVADESFRNVRDIKKYGKFFDLASFKLMKWGGMLACLNGMEAARDQKLDMMYGCMIEEAISVAAAALLSLSQFVKVVDLDGNILLDEIFDRYRDSVLFGLRMQHDHWEVYNSSHQIVL